MKLWSTSSVPAHSVMKSWRMDAKWFPSSLFLSLAVESGPVIFGPQAKQTRANTHTHTRRHQATLDPNSLKRLQCKQWQDYCRIHKTRDGLFSFQWVQLCCLGLTEDKKAEAAKTQNKTNNYFKSLPEIKIKFLPCRNQKINVFVFDLCNLLV